MTQPSTLYEQASYALTQFRERRLADRRFTPRGTADRRAPPMENQAVVQPEKRAVHANTEED